MKNKILMYYSLPLSGHRFCCSVYDMNQFSAIFQIYCRNMFGIKEEESLAMWVCGSDKVSCQYFDSQEEAAKIAAKSIHKLGVTSGVVDLTCLVR